MEEIALKETHCRIIQDAMGRTCHQVGIAFKELQDIGWRTNVFPCFAAVLMLQVGFLVHTRQSPKVWSLVTFVITGTATAAI